MHLSPVDTFLFWPAAALVLAAFVIGLTGRHQYRDDQDPTVQDDQAATDA